MKKLINKLMLLSSLGLLLLSSGSGLAVRAQAQDGQERKIDRQKLDKHFEEATKAINAPSVSVVIFDEDETLFAESYGKGGGQQVPYAIGSLSKSLTALGIMKLVETGKLDLKAKLSESVTLN